MVSQIELFKQIKTCKIDDEIRAVSNKEEEVLESGVLKYQMMYLPEKARLQEMARIGQLEQRLGRLEHIIGSADEKLTTFSQVSNRIYFNSGRFYTSSRKISQR